MYYDIILPGCLPLVNWLLGLDYWKNREVTLVGLLCSKATLYFASPNRAPEANFNIKRVFRGIHWKRNIIMLIELSSLLHWKLSFWQLPVQPVMEISSKWYSCFSVSVSIMKTRQSYLCNGNFYIGKIVSKCWQWSHGSLVSFSMTILSARYYPNQHVTSVILEIPCDDHLSVDVVIDGGINHWSVCRYTVVNKMK